MSLESRRGYRFGEYEARLEGELLLRNGVPLPIQKLPFKMLVVLLENPGGVVSRETLRGRLWEGQTHLQFENGLHVVAAKLRGTLGEEASSPTFIKTIARSGYQFLGEVSPIEDLPDPTLEIAAADAGTQRESSSPLHKHAVLIWSVAGTTLVLALLLTVYLYWRTQNRGIDAGQQKILIGSIANETGDPELDDLLNLPLQLKLQESHYLNLVSNEASRRAVVARNHQGVEDQLASCRSLNAAFLVAGTMTARAGYRLTLTAQRCDSGKVILTQVDDAPTPLALLPVLDRSTARLRQRLGESSQMVQQADAPITQATTNSLAALRAFTLGDAKQRPETATEAISYYKLAVDLDPQFALAYARLGVLYSWLGQDLSSKQAYQSAFDFRNRTTDRERLFITSHYYSQVTAELPRAIQTYLLWAGMFPYDAEPKNNLAVIYNDETSQPDEAMEMAVAAVKLSPDSLAYNTALANAHLNVRDFAYMNHQCQNPQFPARKAPSFLELCYLSYFAQNDAAGMQRETEAAQQGVALELIVDQSAWAAASRGVVSESLRLFLQARQIALRSRRPDDAADIQGEQAIVESAFGLTQQARQDSVSAARADPLSAKTKGLAALVLATAGDTAGAQKMMKSASAQAPQDTVLDLSILSSTRAVLALNANDAGNAVDSLEQSRRYDFCVVANLAPAYYRGLAYAKAHNWKAAATEFQSVLNHQPYMPVSLFVVLAKMELAHAFAESGNEAGARATFAEMDNLWSHADRNFPPVEKLRRYEMAFGHAANSHNQQRQLKN